MFKLRAVWQEHNIIVESSKVEDFLMQLATIQSQNKIGTCPHGLPIGACPICNGMGGGGGVSRRDVPRNAGEMTYNQCAAIGAMLKAQKMAKQAREEQQLQYLQNLAKFQNSMENAIQKNVQLAQRIANAAPTIISKPINFVLNTVLNNVLRFVQNLPTNISNIIQTINQKFADISDKLTAMIGEAKAAIAKTVSETLNSFKKKIKSLFGIFSVQGADDDEKQIEESKRAFELKTFIHDLYNKLTNENKKEIENDAR